MWCRPLNPFLSLSPILDIPGMQGLLRHAARRVVTVSPIIGGQALKGPAGKIMSELGLDVSARVDPLDECAISRIGRCMGLGRD